MIKFCHVGPDFVKYVLVARGQLKRWSDNRFGDFIRCMYISSDTMDDM